MADATFAPGALADRFAGLSSDVLACVLLDSDGRTVAVDGDHAAVRDELGELAAELIARAGGPQVEVSTGGGIVFALREGGWTLVAVTGRFALSSLIFFDMRKALEEVRP